MRGSAIWPRWPAIFATLGTVLLQFALPDSLRVGPKWLIASGTTALVLGAVITRHRRPELNQAIGVALLLWLTAAMGWALTALLLALPSHRESSQQLLVSATSLWFTNVLVFASWYWRLDAGGPNQRDQREAHVVGAFWFPQLQISHRDHGWQPDFVDYLFLAFAISTAFSPTDSPVLSRWAKVAVMVQALVSFVTVAVLVARGVGNL